MEKNSIFDSPNRVADLIDLKQKGASIEFKISFEILPVDFAHRTMSFQAYIFLCRWSGSVDGKAFNFRKCYARGCPNNLCPHVSQAIMIANRYLQLDYRKLELAGIEVEKKLFTLEDMVFKFHEIQEEYTPTLSIYDYITIAKEGNMVSAEVELEYVPGVEHFANYKDSQVFLMVKFKLTSLEKTYLNECCLSCYPAEKEKEEKKLRERIANERLRLLYKEFDKAAIRYKKKFF